MSEIDRSEALLSISKQIGVFREQLETLRSLRSPQLEIPGFSLPSSQKIDLWAAQISSAGTKELVDVMSNIVSEIQTPNLGDDPHFEHLSIFHAMGKVKSSGEMLINALLSLGYLSKFSITVDSQIVKNELREINSQLLKMGHTLSFLEEEAKVAPFSNITLSFGLVEVPIEALRILFKRAVLLASDIVLVNASAIALVSSRMAVDAKKLYAELGALTPKVARPILRKAKELAAIAAVIAEHGADLLKRAVDSLSQPDSAKLLGVVEDSTAGGRRTRRVLVPAQTDIGIDFGDFMTRVHIRGRGIALEVPSVTAVRSISGRTHIEAHGHEGQRAIEAAPSILEAYGPVSFGCIADDEVAESFLTHHLKGIRRRGLLSGPRVVTTAPSLANAVNRRALRDVIARSTNARQIIIVDETVAAAAGANLEGEEYTTNLVVSTRYSTTDVAIVSSGTVAVSRGVRSGIRQMDEAIVNYVRRCHNTAISMSTAAQIRRDIGCARAPPDDQVLSIEFTGMDVYLSVPRQLRMSESEYSVAVSDPVGRIVDTFKDLLGQTPPQLAMHVASQPATLTGDNAILPGLAAELRDYTGLAITIPETPELCVVRGLGKILESPPMLSKVLRDRRTLS